MYPVEVAKGTMIITEGEVGSVAYVIEGMNFKTCHVFEKITDFFINLQVSTIYRTDLKTKDSKGSSKACMKSAHFGPLVLNPKLVLCCMFVFDH